MRSMKLDDVLDGEKALLYMERYVDEDTRTYSRFATKTEVAPEYRPRSDRPSFNLASVVAPREQVSIYEASPNEGLRAFYVHSEDVLFLIHPETWGSPDVDRLNELRL